MKLRVDLSPKQAYPDVVVVIDVLRSATVACMLFQLGVEKLYLSPSIRRAQQLAEENGLLLIGERDGLPPEGFNYGGSPTELFDAEVQGRSAVLVSASSPLALAETTGAKHVLLGSFYNAGAVVAQAAALAESEIALVCCGFRGDEDLDDALCAGYLAAQLKKQQTDLTLTGATFFALGLLKAFPDPAVALWQSRVGHRLRRLNLTEDIGVSSRISQTDAVPKLRMSAEDGSLYCFTAAD